MRPHYVLVHILEKKISYEHCDICSLFILLFTIKNVSGIYTISIVQNTFTKITYHDKYHKRTFFVVNGTGQGTKIKTGKVCLS